MNPREAASVQQNDKLPPFSFTKYCSTHSGYFVQVNLKVNIERVVQVIATVYIP